MGCDIHLFIQYKSIVGDEWEDFGGRIRVTRDYNLFGQLVDGVRTSPGGFLARGIPSDINRYNEAWTEFYDYIACPDEPNNVTEQQAINAGGTIYSDGYNRWTENSDLHSHSYLSTSEYECALQKRAELVQYYTIPVAYKAVLSAMQTLNTYRHHVRIVFAFDN